MQHGRPGPPVLQSLPSRNKGLKHGMITSTLTCSTPVGRVTCALHLPVPVSEPWSMSLIRARQDDAS
eukprot:14395128-Alexandrium_andersonii.AAC.1